MEPTPAKPASKLRRWLIVAFVFVLVSLPWAGVGEILEIPFGRPRDRNELLNDPTYYEYREQLVGFFEERAEARPATDEVQFVR